MKRLMRVILIAGLLNLLVAAPALAGEDVTIVFKSRAIVHIRNAYKQIANGLKDFNRRAGGVENYMLELNLEGNTFFINLADIAVLCRDRCRSMEIIFPKEKR